MNFRQWARVTHKALHDRPAEERQHDFTQAQVETVLRASLNTLIEALANGDDLRVEALGRLWVEEKPPTRKVSNLGGESTTYELDARRVVRLRLSCRLLRRLNQAGENHAS